MADLRSVGVEEELLLVEPDTGRPRAVAGTILHTARQEESGLAGGPGAAASDAAQALDSEMQLQQLETNTQPCHTLDELGREIGRAGRWPPLRRAAPGCRWPRWGPHRSWWSPS